MSDNASPRLKTVIFSSTEFGKACLDVLRALPCIEVTGIATTGRRIVISYSSEPVEIRTYHDFSPDAAQLGVPLYCHSSGFSAAECGAWLRECRADVILVLGWYFMVPRALREMARLGALGIHASLLPKYRGGAPLTWAMINGEPEVGATLFQLGDGVDDGDIFGQSAFLVGEHDDIATVYGRVTAQSVELLRRVMPMIASGDVVGKPQPHELATSFPQRGPADGCIDWNWSAQRIHNFIRAQTRPYPGAFFTIGQRRVTLWRAEQIAGAPVTAPPGTLLCDEQAATFVCGDGLQLRPTDWEDRDTGERLDWRSLKPGDLAC